MRMVMSSSPDWSENFLIFHITYDSYYVIIEMWLSGSEPTIIRRSAVKCMKGPHALNSLINQRQNHYYYYYFQTFYIIRVFLAWRPSRQRQDSSSYDRCLQTSVSVQHETVGTTLHAISGKYDQPCERFGRPPLRCQPESSLYQRILLEIYHQRVKFYSDCYD